jgi:hypothetical protein
MNIYFLKKFRKEAKGRYKLIQINRNLYYVARMWNTDEILCSISGDLSYDDAVKNLNEIRREYVLKKVYEKRLRRGKIINNI